MAARFTCSIGTLTPQEPNGNFPGAGIALRVSITHIRLESFGVYSSGPEVGLGVAKPKARLGLSFGEQWNACAEHLGNCFEFPQLRMCEVRTRVSRGPAFPRNLNHS